VIDFALPSRAATMRPPPFLTLVAVLLSQLHSAAALASIPHSEIKEAFKKWRATHNVTFENAELKEAAFAIFKPRFDGIERHNALFAAGKVLYTLKLTPFADREDQDKYIKFTGLRLHGEGDLDQNEPLRHLTRSAEEEEHRRLKSTVLPDQDWEPWLPPARQQSPCETCWAFATSAAVTGSFQLTRYLNDKNSYWPQSWTTDREQSEQQLLDCDAGWPGGPIDCYQGGSYRKALQWISVKGYYRDGKKYGGKGVALRKDQPYMGTNAGCQNKGYKTILTCNHGNKKASGCGSKDDTPVMCPDADKMDYQEYIDKIKEMLTYAPVVVSIRSCGIPGGYDSGIIMPNDAKKGCSGKVDHAVAIVGWGWDDKLSQTYWKFRNSWGSGWGEDGYFRTKRTANILGIQESDPCIPLGANYA